MTTIDTEQLSYEEWKRIRRNYIGGSDVATALGQSPHKSPYMLWLEKTGRFAFDTGNPVTRFGQLWEPRARKHLRQTTGWEVAEDHLMRVHPEYPMLSANIDGTVYSDELGHGILEIKTTTTMNYRIDGDPENVPISYRLQIQHYLGITGFAYGVLVVYYRDTCTYSAPLVVRADQGLIAGNNQRLADWHIRHIEGDSPPPLSCTDDLKLKYPNPEDGTTIQATDHIIRRYLGLKQVKERLGQLEQLKRSIEIDIKDFMGEAEFLKDQERLLASWKGSSRSYFDSKSFRKDYPGLYKQYKSTTKTRIFRLK